MFSTNWQISVRRQSIPAYGRALLCGLLIVGWSATGWGQDMTPAHLLKANQKTWASVSTFEMEIETQTKYVDGYADKSVQAEVVEMNIFWAKGDGIERYTENRRLIGESTDRLIVNGEESVLTQSRTRQSTALKRQVTRSTFGDETLSLLSGLPPVLSAGKLQEIFSKWKLTTRGPIAAGKDQLWIVNAVNPNPKPDEIGTLLEVEVTFNATHGCLIQKLDRKEVVQQLRMKAGDPLLGPCHQVFEVLRFRDYGNGIHFPEQVQFSLLPDGPIPPGTPASEFSIRFTATRLAVNAPLSAAARDFRFPENIVVAIHGARGTAPRYVLWGPNNQPIREFVNEFELNRFRAEQEGRSYAAEITGKLFTELFLDSFLWMINRIDTAASRSSASIQ